jgi:hypothetical protein
LLLLWLMHHICLVFYLDSTKIWVANVNRKCTGSWYMRMRLCVSGGDKSEKICKIFRKISFMMNISILYVCAHFLLLYFLTIYHLIKETTYCHVRELYPFCAFQDFDSSVLVIIRVICLWLSYIIYVFNKTFIVWSFCSKGCHWSANKAFVCLLVGQWNMFNPLPALRTRMSIVGRMR